MMYCGHGGLMWDTKVGLINGILDCAEMHYQSSCIPFLLLFHWLGPQRTIQKEGYAGGHTQGMVFFSKRQKFSSLCCSPFSGFVIS